METSSVSSVVKTTTHHGEHRDPQRKPQCFSVFSVVKSLKN